MTTFCGDRSTIDRVLSADGIVLISRGGLTWIRALLPLDLPIWVCRGSRLDGEPLRWILRPPDRATQVVLFDRSVTTGCTVVRARNWLTDQGYGVMVVGSPDPLCRLGLRFVDAVLRPAGSGLELISVDRFRELHAPAGWFSLVVDREPPDTGLPVVELPAVPADMAGMVKLAEAELAGDVVIRPGPGWDRESLLIYTHLTGKPAVFIGGPGADFGADDLGDLARWLAQSPGGANNG